MASVGTETVEVVPDARGFAEKLKAQLRDLSVAVNADTAPASAKVDALRARVGSLGATTKIDADTAPVNAKVAEIKAQLDTISRNRVQINVDTAKATAQLAALRLQESSLKEGISNFQSAQGNNSIPVDAGRQLAAVQAQIQAIRNQRLKVDVDTAEANAKVSALKAELNAIPPETKKHVEVDDNGSSANVSSKIAAIADAASFAQAGVAAKTVGIVTAIAAIIPIAAAASVAVAGIGLGLGIGILGAGVAALALNGVGGALSAGSGSGAAKSSQQQAQAVDQQRQAEVSLTVAQRNAAQAQRDLTQARVDAANALQNLTNEVKDNGLAQRQAALDLQTAQRNLTVAKANPDAQNPANSQALAQVQLAFEQAQQNVQDLSDAGSQLAQQQAAAAAAGIAGAAGVVAAQNQVVDTQNALVEAQFQVADSAAKASDATGAYGAALAKLDPAQQAFTHFLQSIKPLFDALKTAVTNSFLPLLQQAITDFLPVITPLATLLGTLGTAFGDLAIDAANFFTSPVFTNFLTFLNTYLGPAIAQFGAIFGNLFTAGIDGFEALAPLLSQFGDVFVTLTGDLATALQGGALDGFIASVQQNLPQIGATLSSVFGAVSSVLSALAPAAGPALQIIQQLAVGIGQLAPVLGPLITLFLQLVNEALKPLIPQLVEVVRELVPPLESLLQAIVPIAGQLVQAFLVLVQALIPLVPILTVLITDLLPPLITFIESLITQGIAPLAATIASTLAPLLPVLATAFENILTALTPLIPQLTTIAIQFLQQIAPHLPEIVQNFGVLAVNVLALLNAVAPLLGPITTLVTTFMTVQNLTIISGIAKAFADLVQALTDLVHGDFSGALSSLKNFFVDLYNTAIKPIVDGISKIAGFVGGGIGNSSSFNAVLNAGHRATGGQVTAGQSYTVGESGWETFVAPSNGYIVNHADSVKAAAKSGSTFNLYSLDANEFAYSVQRRLEFAGA